MLNPLIATLLIASGMGFTSVASAPYEALQEVKRLIENEEFPEALSYANTQLSAKPDDPTWLFYKARALENSGQAKDAIAAYEAVIEQAPQTLAAYNNLAALQYAESASGDKKSARQAAIDTLETGVQAQPEFATVYTNLRKLYWEISRENYLAALDISAPAAELALAQIDAPPETPDDFFEIANELPDNAAQPSADSEAQAGTESDTDGDSTGIQIAAADAQQTRPEIALAEPNKADDDSTQVAMATRSTSEKTGSPDTDTRSSRQTGIIDDYSPTPTVDTSTAPISAQGAEVADQKPEQTAAQPADPKTDKVVVAAQPESTKKPESPKIEAITVATASKPGASVAVSTRVPEAKVRSSAETEKQIKAALNSWAKAWSARDVKQYAQHYQKGYKQGFPTHSAWLKDRRNNFSRKSRIQVKLSKFEITPQDDGIRVYVDQRYSSNNYKDHVQKSLLLKQSGQSWKIASELTRKVYR